MNWRYTHKDPLCKQHDGYIEILFEDYFLIETTIYKNSDLAEMNTEWYVVRVNEYGDLEDCSGQPIGWEWTAVNKWCPILEVIGDEGNQSQTTT